MLNVKRLALAAAVLTMTAMGAFAAPVTPGDQFGIASAGVSDVTTVQYRGRGWGGGYYRGGGWRGPGIGLGIGAGIIAGAIIANEAYRPRRGYYYDTYAYDGPYYYPAEYKGDPRAICARHFRSFEWRSGLYTAYSGEKRLCPYLQ